MDVFGLNGAQLEGGGAHWTAREILQQPQIWRDVQALMAQEAAAMSGFVAPWLTNPQARVVLLGAGTSAYIGGCLAPALARRLGRRVDAIATTDLVASPESCIDRHAPTLLVSFGRSGNSPESLAALDIADRLIADRAHLIVTCDATGALYRRGRSARDARVILLPEASNDRSFAMTSSFTGMLLAAALALGALPADPGCADRRSSLADRVVPGTLPLLRELADRSFRRVVYLGSAELGGLAREAALKMLELTDGRIVAAAETTLGFRHGPKTIVDRDTVVILFMSAEPYTRQYDLDLLRELRQDGIAGRVLSLSSPPVPGAGVDDVELGTHDSQTLAAISDLELTLPYAMFAQSLALMSSVALGLRPDTPNAAGTVHRVVRGVSIHPWRAGV